MNDRSEQSSLRMTKETKSAIMGIVNGNSFADKVEYIVEIAILKPQILKNEIYKLSNQIAKLESIKDSYAEFERRLLKLKGKSEMLVTLGLGIDNEVKNTEEILTEIFTSNNSKGLIGQGKLGG